MLNATRVAINRDTENNNMQVRDNVIVMMGVKNKDTPNSRCYQMFHNHISHYDEFATNVLHILQKWITCTSVLHPTEPAPTSILKWRFIARI